jgi:hypothetical protein
MNAFRTKRGTERYSGADATDAAFNQYAGGAKVMGPLFGTVQKFLGALGAAVGTDLGVLVAVFNDSTTVSYVALGTTSAVAAPTSPANGIAIPPNSYLIVPMGTNNWIISNAATTYGYWLQDDLQYNPNTGAND